MNNRTLKNGVMIMALITLITASYFTIKDTSTIDKPNFMNNNQNRINMKDNQDDFKKGNRNMPEDNNLDDNEEKQDESKNDNRQLPNEKDNEYQNDRQMPEENQNDRAYKGQMPRDNQNNNRPNINHNKMIKTSNYILFGIESLGIASILIYLLMSSFNKIGLHQTLLGDKLIIFILLTVIFTTALVICDHFIVNNHANNQNFIQERTNQRFNNTSVDNSDENLLNM